MAIVRESTSAVAFSAGTDLTLTKPTGVVSGDVLIAWINAITTNASPTTVPTGWTELKGTNASVLDEVFIYWKVAGGTEGASYSWSGFVAGSNPSGVMARYSGVDTTNVGDATATTGTSSNSTTLNVPSITTVTAGAMMISTVGENLATATTCTTANQTIVGNLVTNGNAFGAGELLIAAAGATGTKAWTVTKGSGAAITWALRPAGGAAPEAVRYPIVPV